jgi:phosphohistidine swiveling domain-containing protein
MVKQVKFIFDDSNLNESYSGVTTPLTFSFARRVYESVYIGFCKLLGVQDKEIYKNADLFSNMIDYLGGRMYYNLINWYRMISLLPGYKFNRKFLEGMMGVEKEFAYKKDSKTPPFGKIIDLLLMIYRVIKITAIFLLMDFLIKRFNKNFDKNFAYLESTNLKNKTDKELISFYSSFEKKLTKDFSIPIANDFAVMVSVGILKLLSKKWLGDCDESKTNYLITCGQELKSAEPGKAFNLILVLIESSKKLTDLFQKNPPEKIVEKINFDRSFQNLKKKINIYIKTYGSRVPGELKLESISFQNNPVILIRLLKNSINKKKNTTYYRKILNDKIERQLINLPLFKRKILAFFLSWSKKSIVRREETRFKRTLIFGSARKVFLDFGQRLKDKRKLHKTRDIFYLEIEEIFENLTNKPPRELSKLVKTRKELEKFWEKLDLPRRIITNQSAEKYNQKLTKKIQIKKTKKVEKKIVKGQVASLGGPNSVILGQSLVISEFDPTKNFSDKILITRQTDPGWTIVFPSLKGLVVERGGILSHAAVVAREFGIPCIINAKEATKLIPDNRIVKMELESGIVSVK